MDPISSKVILGAASEPSDPVYVEDFFSIRRYEGGNSSYIDIGGVTSHVNGFSLIKNLSQNTNWALKPYPTSSAFTGWIKMNTGDVEHSSFGSGSPNFTVDGRLYLNEGISGTGAVNQSGSEYCSWNFGSAPGFLDVVYYTGNSTESQDSATQTINHNLGSTPGAIFVKCLGAGNPIDWACHFSSLGFSKILDLSTDDDASIDSNCFNSSNSTSFTVGNDSKTNSTGKSYVAFVFANDDASFGTNRDQSIIKCGKISAGTNVSAALGFEPQFLLLKEDDNNSSWELYDNIRGLTAEDINGSVLNPDTTLAQQASDNIGLQSDGFKAKPSSSSLSDDIYYIAIRRPHKPVQSAAEVYSQTYLTADSTTTSNAFSSGTRSVDTIIQSIRANSASNMMVVQRSTGDAILSTNDDNLEYTGHMSTSAAPTYFDNQFGANPRNIFTTNTGVTHFFSRAPGFYDVVTWTGDSTSTTSAYTKPHNLEAVPELMIVKRRSGSNTFGRNWYVYTDSLGTASFLRLDQGVPATSGSPWPSAPTASNFSVGHYINLSGLTYVAMLFASLPGICKVGSYTASSSYTEQIIDCGFTNGARFVMLKDSSSSLTSSYVPNFYVNTAAQGITSGADLTDLWNLATVESNSNNVKPHSSGFIATRSGSTDSSSEISSGATVQFLAIA